VLVCGEDARRGSVVVVGRDVPSANRRR
jgi:hypothetical protein